MAKHLLVLLSDPWRPPQVPYGSMTTEQRIDMYHYGIPVLELLSKIPICLEAAAIAEAEGEWLKEHLADMYFYAIYLGWKDKIAPEQVADDIAKNLQAAKEHVLLDTLPDDGMRH